MKNSIIETALIVFGLICFILICSEPAEGTSTGKWLLGEVALFALLIGDALLCTHLGKRQKRKDTTATR